jgi:Large polyvalent protein associated domain 38
MELDQVLQALRNADAAGDIEGAKRLAQIAQQLASGAEEPPRPKEKEPESGFLPSLKASTETLKGDIAALAGRAGLMDVQKAEEYQKAREAEAQKIYRPTEKGYLEAPLTKIGELLGGSLPYMAAPVAAGLLAPEGLAGLAATGAVSATQFAGSNLARQMQEGKGLAQTNLGSAALAAVPQAALDVLSLKMIPGIKGIFGEVGEKLSNAEAKKIAEQGLSKTLGDYALQTGKTAGIEGTTEAAQQVFERLQAGLNINDPQARQEYFDNFLGGAVLGGALAPAGRYIERSQARGQAAQAQQEEQKQEQIKALKAQQEADALEEQRKQDPAYMTQFAQDYEALEEQYKQLRSQTKKPNLKEALPSEIGQYEQNKQALSDLRNKLNEGRDEYGRIRPLLNQLKAQQKTQADQAAQQRLQDLELETAKTQEAQPYPYYQAPQGTLPGIEPVPTPTKPVERNINKEALALAQREQEMARLKASHRAEEEAASARGDIEALKDLRKRSELLDNEHAFVQKQLKLLGGYKPATSKRLELEEELQNQKDALKSLKGAYDPKKADQILANIDELNARIEEDKKKFGEATMQQQGFDYGKADRTPFIESRESAEARRQEKLAEERRQRQEFYETKMRPELQGIQRLAIRSGQGPEILGMLPQMEQAPAERGYGSAAMGQMQQSLEGIEPGTDLLHTAEEPKAREFRKAPSEGFRLFPNREQPIRPDDKANLEQRLTRAMADHEMPQDTYAFLRRAEEALAVPNPDTEFMHLLDEQLTKIENGEEGMPRRGAPVGTQELKTFPRGETQVSKRVEKTAERPILRGPSTQVKPLALQKDLEERLRVSEANKGEGPLSKEAEKQGALFPEEQEKLGVARSTPARFQKFLDSAFVKKLRLSLDKDLSELQKLNTVDELKKRADKLAAEVEAMEKVNLEYKEAQRTFKHQADIGKQKRDINEIRTALVSGVIKRMDLQGKLDALKKARNEIDAQAKDNLISGWDGYDPDLFANLNHVEEEYQRAVNEVAEMQGALSTLEGRLKVEEAKIKIAKLNPLTTPKEKLAAAKTALEAARTDLGEAQKTASKEILANKEAEAKKAREDEAVRRAKEIDRKNQAAKDEQKRLEAMYGKSVKGEEYEAITEAQRMARELPEKPRTASEEAAIKGNPNKVLGGYISKVTALEKKIKASQDKSKAARMQSLEGLRTRVENLNKAYKNATSADARAALVNKIDTAEREYNDAVDKLTAEPITWVGMKKDIRDLAEALEQQNSLEERIKSGEFLTIEERAPKAFTRPSRAALAEEKAKREAAAAKESATRANAPTTSGESLTKSQVKKAVKQSGTQYTGKGVGEESQARVAKEVKTKEIVGNERKYEALKAKKASALNPFEKNFIRAYETKYGGKSSGLAEQILKTPDTGVFRTTTQIGAGMKEQEVQRLADRILSNWAITPEVKIVADEKGLPQAIQDQAAKDGVTGQIPGVYDPNTKTVYLVANNLHTGEDVALTIAHEVAGHFGLREMLGDQYKSTMDDIYNGNESVREKANAKMAQNKNLNQQVATEEVLADLAETGPTAKDKSALRQIIDAIKKWFRNTFGTPRVTDEEVRQIVANARKYVQEGRGGKGGKVDTSGPVFRVEPKYNNAELASIGKIADKFIAKEKTFADKVKANTSGLAAETQLVDRFAGFERLSKLMEPLKGYQMMYYLRMYDQKMNFVSQAVAHGALHLAEKTRADGRKEYIIEAKDGPSLASTVEVLKEAKDIVGNGEAINRLFTLYISAIRAKDKGFSALHFGNNLTQAELNQAFDKINANEQLKDIFDRARNEYNAFNRNQLEFVAQSGALSKETVARLLKENDYIPWYRERNGVAELIIGNETPIRIGSIAEQPYLHDLVGGDAPILDFMTSSVQNTNLLADMALRNLATKNAIFELVNMDLAVIGKNKGATGPDVVKFKVNGEDRFAIIDTDKVGVPADILVKGMEGIPTQMPFVFRMLGIPAKLIRKTVTASPLYAAKQLFRDSLAAPIIAGANFTPVLGSLKELSGATKATLERRGVTGGQIFTGTTEDLSKILRDIANDKPGWLNSLAKWEALSMEADATTRRAQYNSYIEQGLSEMEATLLSLESMNFNKRGASPSIHIVSSLIPFFNAQIQSLNVLYKALTGKLPFNEKLKIQEKLLTRGAMLAAGTLAYATMMQDDEAYKNATPDQKYNNWFIRVPGVDEPVRLPIPFEIGYIFKALPEALYNTMVNEHGKEEAVQAFGGIMKQLIPGGTSYGIPQALRPAIEAGLGKSFYTGRDILSQHEQALLPEDQFRVNTTEAAKAFGKATGTSPIILEELVRGYTGTMGLAFLQAVSMGIPKGESPEKAYMRLSEMPVIGGAFQPNDAGAIINSVYNRMGEFKKVEASVDDLIARGYKADAKELLAKRGNEYAASEVADYYTSTMRDLTAYENAVRASNMTPEQKREKLNEIKQTKIRFANMVRNATDKSIPQ